MFKYTTKYCMMGMMSKTSQPFDDWSGYRKNSTTAVCFNEATKPDFPKINYSYIYDKPAVKASKSTQIVSIFNDEFFKLEGYNNREIRETRNKFNKIITIGEYNKDQVMGLIDRWDIQSGGKYGWQRHSGYDRTFFDKWYDQEKDNLFSRFYYHEDLMVGYAILHKEPTHYNYLIRKTDNSMRNMCLYVDYKTFEEVYIKDQKNFLVNWGASSGGVLKYKRKFPIHKEQKVYFYTERATK